MLYVLLKNEVEKERICENISFETNILNFSKP